jgi:glycine/D-amino acid oxidase-like deaminating enzyme
VVGKSADKLFSLVRDYGIDCEANQRGWIQPAVSQKQLERVRRCAESWSTQGANVEILGAKATAAALGSDFYRGGWRAVDGGSVQPLALARGLAMAAISEGARVCERSPVSAIDKVAEGWRLKIGQHSVIAEKVILATAADTAGLAPELSNQIVTAYFYQLATEPLEKGPALLPGCGAMSDAQGDLYFFRKDAAQRLITGGTFIVTRNWKRRLRSQVQQRLDHVFPDLGEWRIETQWSGYVAMTYDFFPRLAELGQNCFGWIGCNGRGVALSVSMGEQLAQLVAGQRHEDLSFPIETHAALPFRKLAPVGVAASLMSLRTSDCLQRLQNRS